MVPFILIALLLAPSSSSFAEPPAQRLRPFRTDGCTAKFGNLKREWTECCVAHDFAYWVGGSQERKKIADVELKSCFERSGFLGAIAAKVWSSQIAERISQEHWGAGWSPRRDDQELTPKEWAMVDKYYALFKERQPILKSMTPEICQGRVLQALAHQTLVDSLANLSCFPLVSETVADKEWIAFSPECVGFYIIDERGGDENSQPPVSAFGECMLANLKMATVEMPTCRFAQTDLEKIYAVTKYLLQEIGD